VHSIFNEEAIHTYLVTKLRALNGYPNKNIGNHKYTDQFIFDMIFSLISYSKLMGLDWDEFNILVSDGRVDDIEYLHEFRTVIEGLSQIIIDDLIEHRHYMRSQPNRH
jgi:hypothetical protein